MILCDLSSVFIVFVLLIHALTKLSKKTCLVKQDFLRQVVVTAAFTVAMLVFPVLLRLNYLPRWLGVVVMYPLFSCAVDKNGVGESFAPNILLSFDLLEKQETNSHYFLIGSILGGLVGGRLMASYFPDERKGDLKE
jgi:hypothetical protein